MPFLLLLKSYWKPLLGASLALMVIIGSYAKGKKDCALEHYKNSLREVEARTVEATEEASRSDRISDSIRADRVKQPLNDERDSCLLSNDPFKVRCIK